MSKVGLLSVLAVVFAPPVWAQSVQGSCVGSINPDGTVNKGDCGGATPPGRPSGGASGAVGQGAHAVGEALGNAIVNALVGKPGPTAAEGQARQRQEQLQLQDQLRQRKAIARQGVAGDTQQPAAQNGFQQDKDQLLGALKGDQPDELHRVFTENEGTFHARVGWDDHLRAGIDYQHARTRKDPANQKNEDWCKLHRPLLSAVDSEKDRWDERCSEGGRPAQAARPAEPDQAHKEAPTLGGIRLK